MKVKILVSCSGLTFSYVEGQTVDVEKYIGEDLVKCGFAEEVKSEKNTKRDTKPKVVKEGDTKIEGEKAQDKAEISGENNADT